MEKKKHIEPYPEEPEVYQDWVVDGPPDFHGELKEAAWNILHENPGFGYNQWKTALMEQYPAEVVDALGVNPMTAYSELDNIWEESGYKDPFTGISHTFQQWAEYFSSELSVESYDMLAEEKRGLF